MSVVRSLGSLVFALALSGSFYSAQAATCRDVIGNSSGSTVQSAAVQKLVVKDGYDQWLLWEQTANMQIFRKSPEPVMVPLVDIPRNEIDIEITDRAPSQLVKLFESPDGNVFWPKHPYNTSKKVPYIKNEPATELPTYFTSSRSLALGGELRGFTIKLATDHPHGPNGEYQPGKVKTNDDVDSALIHSNHLANADKELGDDPVLVIFPEVMTLSEKKTGIGMVVRDVRMLEDGNYYLPALSIPYVGREIAAANGVEFGAFFEKNYGALLGEAKARLLLRTGLQMLTPNAQNSLIQLDRNLRPTGKIVIRDVSDSYLVGPVAEGLGYAAQIELDNKAEYPPVKEINPYWSNSSWRFDEAGRKSVSRKMIDQWGEAHNKAYVDYINKELGLNIKVESGDELPAVYKMLASDIGQQKLKQYRARLKKAAKAAGVAAAS